MAGKKQTLPKSRAAAPAAATSSVVRQSDIAAEIAALNEKIKRALPELEAQAERLLRKSGH